MRKVLQPAPAEYSSGKSELTELSLHTLLLLSQEIGLKSKTFGELRRRVAFIARALRTHGVTKGDRVAG